MKKLFIVILLFIPLAVLAANPVSIQTLLGNLPKETAPQASTRVVTTRGGVLRQLPYTSLGGVALGRYTSGRTALSVKTTGTFTAGSATELATSNVIAASWPTAYQLPTASGSVLGGIKVGAGLAMDGDTLRATATGNSGGCGQAVNSFNSNTVIRNGNIYVGSTTAQLTFRNHSSGKTSIFALYSTRIIPDNSNGAKSQIAWTHPTAFTNHTTSAGYSIKIPANTYVDIVSYGSPYFRVLMTTQDLVKTGIDEYYAAPAACSTNSVYATSTKDSTVTGGVYDSATAYAEGQSFTLSTTKSIYSISVYASNNATTTTLSLDTNIGQTNSPHTVTKTDITNSMGWVEYVFATPVELTAGTYYFVITSPSGYSNAMLIEFGYYPSEPDGYTGGTMYQAYNGIANIAAYPGDLMFRVNTCD